MFNNAIGPSDQKQKKFKARGKIGSKKIGNLSNMSPIASDRSKKYIKFAPNEQSDSSKVNVTGDEDELLDNSVEDLTTKKHVSEGSSNRVSPGLRQQRTKILIRSNFFTKT